MPPYQVHNVRFFDLTPRSGHCMAYCHQRKLLAVSRADMSIEIWNFSIPNSPILERSIPGEASEGSIEALAWAKPKSENSEDSKQWRLFSAGLHGLVIEHRLESKEIKDYLHYYPQRNSWAVTSGAGWCMKFNEASGKLAIGTEEGFVCLFDVIKDGLDFDKVLDKQEGRILCLEWHSEGKHIVTGSPDTLRLWDVTSGHPLLRMSTGRSEKNRETIVWSVGIMDDFTIVSGDSRGKTSFWNGKTGTLLDSYQTHKADVLSVAVDKDQQAVYSSGVDPVLMQFQPVFKNDQRRKWVKALHRTTNTHDVRAIVCIDKQKVVSVGVDSNLCVSGPGHWSAKYPPIPHGNNIITVPESNHIALRKQSVIDVWRLGKAHPTDIDTEDLSQIDPQFSNKFLALKEQPVKILELKTKDDETIENFHLSPTAGYIGYVTGTKLRVYRIQSPDDKMMTDDSSNDKTPSRPTISRIDMKLTPHIVPTSIHFYCHNKNDCLLTATPGIGLKCYQITTVDMSASPVFRLLPSQMDLQSDVSKIVTNAAGTFAVVSDFDGNLVVVDLANEKVSAKFPRYDVAPVVTFAIHPKTENVIIVYANHHFVECNPKSGKYTKFSATYLNDDVAAFLPKQFTSKSQPTSGIIFPNTSKKQYEDTIIFYDCQNIFVLDKSVFTSEEVEKTEVKVSKTSSTVTKAITKQTSAMRVIKKYQYLVHLGAPGCE